MTVIVDPIGAPAIGFKADTEVIYAAMAAGSDGSTATVLPAPTRKAIVEVDCDSTAKGVRFAANCEVGDLYELHVVGTHPFNVYDEAGVLVTPFGSLPNNRPLFRKLTNGNWR